MVRSHRVIFMIVTGRLVAAKVILSTFNKVTQEVNQGSILLATATLIRIGDRALESKVLGLLKQKYSSSKFKEIEELYLELKG